MMRERKEELTVNIIGHYTKNFQKLSIFVILLWYIIIGFFINITFKYVPTVY